MVAATDGESSAVMLTYFTNEEEAKNKTVSVNLQQNTKKEYATLLLDATHDAERVATAKMEDDTITLTMAPNTVVLLQSE